MTGPACVGSDPEIFFPPPWEVTPVEAPPSNGEREALAVCAGCPVRSWCLEDDLASASTASRVLGVRGGLRQSERRAMHRARYGRRPRYGTAPAEVSS
ncbi:WhiB family transcriptional regulator [Streptomyces fradiae]|uniref:WhiB family transcriptional regulator n=1 Tax=Streptomyces fradiae TaxID=1906 RepID=UPI0033E0CF4C